MPDRRKVRKGSFAGHLDQLVEHFTPESPPRTAVPSKLSRRKRKPKTASVHQALFDGAAH